MNNFELGIIFEATFHHYRFIWATEGKPMNKNHDKPFKVEHWSKQSKRVTLSFKASFYKVSVMCLEGEKSQFLHSYYFCIRKAEMMKLLN